MAPLRPAAVRVILVLSLLAIAGSIMILLERQGRASRLNLEFLWQGGDYRYAYKPEDLKAGVAPDSTFRLLARMEAIQSDSARIDINNCGYYDLEALPGIGPALALRIIEYRDSAGGFDSIGELGNVAGIGPAKLGVIRDRVIIR